MFHTGYTLPYHAKFGFVSFFKSVNRCVLLVMNSYTGQLKAATHKNDTHHRKQIEKRLNRQRTLSTTTRAHAWIQMNHNEVKRMCKKGRGTQPTQKKTNQIYWMEIKLYKNLIEVNIRIVVSTGSSSLFRSILIYLPILPIYGVRNRIVTVFQKSQPTCVCHLYTVIRANENRHDNQKKCSTCSHERAIYLKRSKKQKRIARS